MKVTRVKNKKSKKQGSQAQSSSDKPTQEEINRILDKMNESGYENLSKQEQQKLFRASDENDR